MKDIHRMQLALDDGGGIRVHNAGIISTTPLQYPEGQFLVSISSTAVAALAWWVLGTEQHLDRSASEATALLAQRMENLGYMVEDHQALYRALRRLCEPGPPFEPNEVQFTARHESPEPPEHMVYEVWGSKMDALTPKFQKHTELAQATWHARRILEINGVGTHVHIVAHSSNEYR
jgi:hypothetical protein